MKTVLQLPAKTVPLCSTAAVMVVFFLIFWMTPSVAPGSKPDLPSEFVRQYQFVESYDQRVAFIASVLAIVVLSVIAFVITQRRLTQPVGPSIVPKVNFWIAGSATIIGLVIYALLI